MRLIHFTLLLACANSEKGLVDLPSDVMMQVVSNIGSYRELVAFNITRKTFYSIIRPIFDFATACQVNPVRTWPNKLLRIRTDEVARMDLCASHLMRYSYLYERVSFLGMPLTIAALFTEITAPIRSTVEIDFPIRTLNTQSLDQVIKSIRYGSVNLIIFGQLINQEMVNLLKAALDRRSTPQSQIEGISFYFDIISPYTAFTEFFQALAYSDLKYLSLRGEFSASDVSLLAAVIPFSKLTKFEHFRPQISAQPSSMEPYRTLGLALTQTPTMKKISFLYLRYSKDVLYGLAPAIAHSNIEKLEFVTGGVMDDSVALITTFPASMKTLKIFGSKLNTTTIVNLIGVVAQSNVLNLNLASNNAPINGTDLQRILAYVGRSELELLDLTGNLIDHETEGVMQLGKTKIMF